jgi:hypothetical protein
MREVIAREQPHVFGVRRRARTQDHERVRRLAPFLVWQSHDGGFLHGRVAQQHALHFD